MHRKFFPSHPKDNQTDFVLCACLNVTLVVHKYRIDQSLNLTTSFSMESSEVILFDIRIYFYNFFTSIDLRVINFLNIEKSVYFGLYKHFKSWIVQFFRKYRKCSLLGFALLFYKMKIWLIKNNTWNEFFQYIKNERMLKEHSVYNKR